MMDKLKRYVSQKQQELRSRRQFCERLDEFGWLPSRPDEDLDEDFIVHIYFEGRATCVTFHAQLKSMTNLVERRQGDYLVYDAIKVKDLKHWADSTDRVFSDIALSKTGNKGIRHYLSNIELKVVKAGLETVTVSNEHQKRFLELRIRVSKLGETKFSLQVNPNHFDDMQTIRKALHFLKAVALGGTLRFISPPLDKIFGDIPPPFPKKLWFPFIVLKNQVVFNSKASTFFDKINRINKIFLSFHPVNLVNLVKAFLCKVHKLVMETT